MVYVLAPCRPCCCPPFCFYPGEHPDENAFRIGLGGIGAGAVDESRYPYSDYVQEPTPEIPGGVTNQSWILQNEIDYDPGEVPNPCEHMSGSHVIEWAFSQGNTSPNPWKLDAQCPAQVYAFNSAEDTSTGVPVDAHKSSPIKRIYNPIGERFPGIDLPSATAGGIQNPLTGKNQWYWDFQGVFTTRREDPDIEPCAEFLLQVFEWQPAIVEGEQFGGGLAPQRYTKYQAGGWVASWYYDREQREWHIPFRSDENPWGFQSAPNDVESERVGHNGGRTFFACEVDDDTITSVKLVEGVS